MRPLLSLLLALCVAAPSGAQVFSDFDGVSAASTLPAFPRPVTAPRPPRAPRVPRTPRAPAEPPASTPSAGVGGSVSFHGVSLPARAFSRTDRIPDSLVAAIDATNSRLYLALYELNLAGVADAIVRAKGRGVEVKLIYDEGHGAPAAGGGGSQPFVQAQGGSQPGFASGPSAQFSQLVSAGIETRLLKGGGSYGIMHNKVAVFDDELVETGSFNWTNAADQANFENALFRDDASLASLYETYFDWMWNFGTPVGGNANLRGGSFGAPPSDPSPSVRFKGEAWPRASFSPGGGTEARLADAISRCQRTLDIAIFSFYSQPIADAVAAAKARGVTVRVVADVSQARRSPQVASLVNGGTDLRLSAGRGARGVLHHKFALLDGEMLATGSFNFSGNAENNNFENQFYSNDGDDLAAFQAEFEAVWAQAHAPAPGEVSGAGVAVR